MENTRRSALVTGAASGIGRATVEVLQAEGFDVLLADLGDRAEASAAELGVEACPLDVTDRDAWAALAGTLEGRRLDALVLNAGIAGGGTELATLDLERYHRLMRVNVDGVVYGLTALLPRMARPGAVVVTCSLAGLIGLPADPVYAMTKHALVGLVRSCADELAARGVGIHAVCPSFAATPLLGAARRQFDEAGYPLLAAAEVARAIADLATGRRSELVTVLQAGREPLEYRFAGIPGARLDDGTRAPLPPTDLDLGSS
ncbi:MAG: SDR family oxidoreductase [Sporichthyaceae bacterium]